MPPRIASYYLSGPDISAKTAMSASDNPFMSFSCKRQKLTSTKAKPSTTEEAEEECATSSSTEAHGPHRETNETSASTSATCRPAESSVPKAMHKKSPATKARQKKATGAEAQQQDGDDEGQRPTDTPAKASGKSSQKASSTILVPPAINGFDGWIPKYEGGHVMPYVSLNTRNGWRERFSGVCETCFEEGRPCPHYREAPLKLLILGWCLLFVCRV